MPYFEEVLHLNAHRPWPLAQGRWKYYQEWNDAIFLHWKVAPEMLRERVPECLEIDLFDNNAWVSFVAFDMHNVRPRNVPGFAPISNFHELNFRTYVRYKGKQGVYFLSIEGAKRLSCFIAKAMSQLPYRYAAMQRTADSFSVKNSKSGAHFKIQFSKGERISEKQPIDLWLTERYALFQNAGPYLNAYEIHHPEWPLQELSIAALAMNYPGFEALLINKPDLCHYSPGVPVLAWDKECCMIKQ